MTNQNQKPENLLGEKIFDSNPLCYICSGKPELGPGTIFVSGYCQKCQGNGLFAVDRGTWSNTLKVGQLDGKPFVEATKNPENLPHFETLSLSKDGYGVRKLKCPKCESIIMDNTFTELAIGGSLKERFAYLEGKYCTGCYMESVFQGLPKLKEV